jgi:hypothetical protein
VLPAAGPGAPFRIRNGASDESIRLQPRHPAGLYLWALLLLLSSLCIGSSRALAHDIPGELRVHMHVKPEGNRLQVFVRVPLALLLNLNLPKHGPGYLDLAQVEAELPRVIAALDKDIEWSEGGQRLSLAGGEARISVPSDRSFESFEKARELLAAPRLPSSTYVFWNQGYLDASLQYPISSARASVELDFHVAPGLRDRLKLDLRYTTADSVVRAYELNTGAGSVALDPHWNQAAWSFVKSGFTHILDGPDHLLFLLCLILPFRRLSGYLLAVVTSFTVAHSVTLIAAAYGLTPGGPWFKPLVETLIAASVLYMAIENIVRKNIERRWIWSGVFGLVHGFGFSFLLASQLQFAGSHLLLSLVSFNIGIEAGQILVLLVTLPAISLLLASGWIAERTFTVVVSVLVAHTAWHWATERAQEFWAADWTAMDALPFVASAIGVAIAAAVGAAGLRALTAQHRRPPPRLQDS